MRLLFFFLVPLLLLCPAEPGNAASASATAACSLANARPTAIAEVQAKPESWIGRCVRARGIAAGGRLYADREAVAELVRPLGEDASRSIVIYPTRTAPAPARAANVEVAGRIGSCAYAHAALERMQAEQPDSILMVGGYCHTSLATYIDPVSVRRLGGRVQRLVEAELPKARRALVEAPATMPGAVEHLSALRALVAAVEAEDEAGFRRMVSPESQDQLDKLGGKPAPDWLKDDLEQVHRQFVAVTRQQGYRDVQVWKAFVDRDTLAEWRKSPATAPDGLVLCGCRTADCTGRWPVTLLDADRNPARPYLCFRSEAYQLWQSKKKAVRINLESSEYGFDEPVWMTAAN